MKLTSNSKQFFEWNTKLQYLHPVEENEVTKHFIEEKEIICMHWAEWRIKQVLRRGAYNPQCNAWTRSFAEIEIVIQIWDINWVNDSQWQFHLKRMERVYIRRKLKLGFLHQQGLWQAESVVQWKWVWQMKNTKSWLTVLWI